MWEGGGMPFQAAVGRVGQLHRSTLSMGTAFPRFITDENATYQD